MLKKPLWFGWLHNPKPKIELVPDVFSFIKIGES